MMLSTLSVRFSNSVFCTQSNVESDVSLQLGCMVAWFLFGFRDGRGRFGLIGIITIGLLKVLEVLVAELVGADEGSNLGVTNVVELAHEAGGSQGEETLDSARERGHGLVMCGVGDVLQDANVCPLLFCPIVSENSLYIVELR